MGIFKFWRLRVLRYAALEFQGAELRHMIPANLILLTCVSAADMLVRISLVVFSKVDQEFKSLKRSPDYKTPPQTTQATQ